MRILEINERTTPVKTIRFAMDIDPTDALTIAKALNAQAMGIKVVFSTEDQDILNKIAQTIIARYSEQNINYAGTVYEIWAKGKRRAHLWFRREEDMFLGCNMGLNFIHACTHYFTNVCFADGAYNPRNNTLSGHVLYGISNEGIPINKEIEE